VFSIITPTFNRAKILNLSLDSSIIFSRDFYAADELIIIDDASTDNTCDYVMSNYKKHLDEGFIKYLSLTINRGVTSAKNSGALSARNDWLVFLDSDDQLLLGARDTIISALRDFPETDVFFFRCVDDTFSLVGPEINESRILSVSELIKHGTYGECLPVIRKSLFTAYPYDDDLRGFEGLTYLKMVMSGAVLRIIKDPVRKYSLLGDDRLSTKLNLLLRSDSILLGHRRYYELVKTELEVLARVFIKLKIFKYCLLSVVGFVLRKFL